MDTNDELENEEKINYPKIINLQSQLLSNKKNKLSLKDDQNNIDNDDLNSIISKDDFEEKVKINNPLIKFKNKTNKKSEDNISTTIKSSNNDKIKNVTFSTVEIIRVESYKQYYKINTIKKKDIKFLEGKNCFIFQANNNKKRIKAREIYTIFLVSKYTNEIPCNFLFNQNKIINICIYKNDISYLIDYFFGNVFPIFLNKI